MLLEQTSDGVRRRTLSKKWDGFEQRLRARFNVEKFPCGLLQAVQDVTMFPGTHSLKETRSLWERVMVFDQSEVDFSYFSLRDGTSCPPFGHFANCIALWLLRKGSDRELIERLLKDNGNRSDKSKEHTLEFIRSAWNTEGPATDLAESARLFKMVFGNDSYKHYLEKNSPFIQSEQHLKKQNKADTELLKRLSFQERGRTTVRAEGQTTQNPRTTLRASLETEPRFDMREDTLLYMRNQRMRDDTLLSGPLTRILLPSPLRWSS
jgi:hypothetical protein